MSELFDRACMVQMGTVLVSGLRTQFKIEKSDQATPSNAQITVWNMSRKTRDMMIGLPVPLVLMAGYGSNLEQIFNGDIAPTGVSVVRNGPDWLTTFKVGDGLKCYQTDRVQIPIPKNFDVKKALSSVLAQLRNVNTAKAISDLSQGRLPVLGQFQQLLNGGVASGRGIDEAQKLAKSIGYKVTIVDGALQLTPATEDPALAGAWPTDMVPDLTPSTGLIGSPEAVKDKFTKVKCLLRPAIKPNLMFRVVWSIHPEGLYMRAHRVTHTGDTRGQEWYTEIEGKAL